MALEKQIWLDQIAKNFYPDSSFLGHTLDFSTFVDNHTINMAEAGLDPAVYINNKTYPIPIKDRRDKPIEIPLDTFSTENTIIRDAEKKELSYDKVESVLFSHRSALQAACARKAAHAIAPLENGDFTPVITTTGKVINGIKTLNIVDILHLKSRFDEAEVPLEDRVLVLSSDHIRDLILADVECFKDIADLKNGVPNKFAGFSILPFTKMPTYDSAGKKNAFDASPKVGDRKASFAFVKSEVMRADGQFTMFSRLNDPEERGDIIGFAKRFICLPLRNRGIGAIISDLG